MATPSKISLSAKVTLNKHRRHLYPFSIFTIRSSSICITIHNHYSSILTLVHSVCPIKVHRESVTMGGFCCCPCDNDFEEYSFYPANSIYRHCTCLRFFVHQLFTGYNTTFHRLDGRSASSSPIQGATSSRVSSEIGFITAPTSFEEAEQRYSRLQRDGLVSRRDKPMTQFQEESQPLRRDLNSSTIEMKKLAGSNIVEVVKPSLSEAPEKALPTGVMFVSSSCSEDEDVCPTCLDEYSTENPKIVTRCSHHFHLGCIYEWMERSDSCPICGKEMEFCESP